MAGQNEKLLQINAPSHFPDASDFMGDLDGDLHCFPPFQIALQTLINKSVNGVYILKQYPNHSVY